MDVARLPPSRRREEVRAWWTDHLRAQRESGQTQAAYCRGRGLDAKYFTPWKRKLLADHVASERPESPRLGPVPAVRRDLQHSNLRSGDESHRTRRHGDRPRAAVAQPAADGDRGARCLMNERPRARRGEVSRGEARRGDGATARPIQRTRSSELSCGVGAPRSPAHPDPRSAAAGPPAAAPD